MPYLPPTVVKKSPTVELHIGVSEFQGETRLDVREFRQYGDVEEFRPTKTGVSLSANMIDEVIAALQKHKAEMPIRVTDIEDGVRYFIGKTSEDALFHKKHVYKTKEGALEKTPPDGYKLFRLRIEKGAVVGKKTLAVRKKSKWVDI